VPEEFAKIFFWDIHYAGYRGYSVRFGVLVKGLLEWRRGVYLRSRSRPRLCNLRAGVLCLMVGCIVAAMCQVRMPPRPCNVFPGEAGHHVEAGLAFGAHRVRHLLDQPRSQHQETYQICEATTPMARAKAQQQDEHESRVQEALRAIRGGLEGGVAAAVELYRIPRTTLYYRLSGERKTRREGHIDQQRLTVAEEKAITKWCFDMDDRGFPPRLDMMRDMASHLEMKRLGKMGEPFGNNWL